MRRLEQIRELASKTLELGDPLIHLGQLSLQSCLHTPAWAGAVQRELEDLPDFFKRKAERLRFSNELNAPDQVGRV